MAYCIALAALLVLIGLTRLADYLFPYPSDCDLLDWKDEAN